MTTTPPSLKEKGEPHPKKGMALPNPSFNVAFYFIEHFISIYKVQSFESQFSSSVKI